MEQYLLMVRYVQVQIVQYYVLFFYDNNILYSFENIFFYNFSQTGSGKTFTITGGAERYVDRGIIPRTLSYVFEQVLKVYT